MRTIEIRAQKYALIICSAQSMESSAAHMYWGSRLMWFGRNQKTKYSSRDKVLIEMYSTIGRTGCAKLLPTRSLYSIGARAGFLGLTNDKRHTPTQNDLEVIRANYKHRGGRRKCVQLLPHLTPSAISHQAEKLGVLQRGRKNWTDTENKLLRLNYASKGKNWCAQHLPDRTPNSIAVQAKNLGLAIDLQGTYFKTWQSRAATSKRGRSNPSAGERMKKLWKQGRISPSVITPERRQKHSDTMRAWHAQHGNPNKGKKLSSEIKLKMSAASRRMWGDPEFRAKMLTPERRERRRQASSENWIRSGRASENAYSRCSGGRRNDLGGMFFRSGWEANYARILNLLKEKNEIYHWEFEPDTFKFPVDARPFSYTPDFKVWCNDVDYYYVEIKGRMDEMSKLKLSFIEKFHPDVPILIIDPKAYKKLQEEFSSRIANWEFYSSRYIAKQNHMKTLLSTCP